MRKLGIIICILVVGFFSTYQYLGGNFLNDPQKDKIATSSPNNRHQMMMNDMSNQNMHHHSMMNDKNTNDAITQKEAEQTAISDSQEDANSIRNLRTKEDTYRKADIYDVKFNTVDRKYDYKIEIATGKILFREYEINERNLQKMHGKTISQKEAFNLIHREIPNLPSDNLQLQREHDDDRTEYEGKASFQGINYEFEIDADAGMISKWKEWRN